MNKKYFRVWNPEVFITNENTYDFCEIDQITEENGYNEKDRKEIESLELSEMWVSDTYGENHTIIRVR